MRFSRPEERFSPAALALAALVHVLLAAFLFLGVQWKRQAPSAVAVELWGGSLPAASSSGAQRSAPPAPKPEPKPEPKPAPPTPAPEPKPEPRPEPRIKPDIAVKDDKKPEPKKPEPKPEPKKPEPKPEPKKPEPLLKPRDLSGELDRELKQSQRRAQQRAAQDARAAANDRIAAQLGAESGAREGSPSGGATGGTSGGRSGAAGMGGYIDKVRAKIRGNIVLPPNIPGNPEAIFIVRQLPSGDIIGEPRMIRSSGHKAYDDAIVRAIKKSSPLPKPDDPSLFQRELELRFRPLE